MTSDSTRSGLAWRGIVVGACAGAVVGAADAARALISHDELVQAGDAPRVVLAYAACFAPCGLLASVVARLFDLPRRALHLLVAFGASLFFAACWINVALLPGFTSRTSIAADVALVLVTALWFRARYRDTAVDGMPTRRWFLAGCLSVAASFGAAILLPQRDDGPAPSTSATAGAARPNVLVYLCDTLRADHLGCYGYGPPTSAEIDAFAKDATVFNDCRAVTSWTKPSVASLFTSWYPTMHGCVEQREVLSPEAETLAEVFRAAGWRTGAFVDNPFVSPEYGLGQGFESFHYERPSIVISGTLLGKALFMLSAHLPVGDTVRRWCGFAEDDARSCAALNAALLQKFGGKDAAPWFAYVHAMEPHLRNYRYEPTHADAEEMGLPPGAPFLGPPPYNGILPFQTAPEPPPELLRSLVTQYDACIRGFSREFGKLMDELRKRGMLENTIVVFVADHGEEFHEHGGWTHGHSLHREVTQVPLVVRLPDSLGDAAKASRGRRVGGVATLLDVMPTLLELCSVKYPRGEATAGGTSLVPEMLPRKGRLEPTVPERRLLGEVTMKPVGLRSVREGRWQLIVAHEPFNEDVALYDDAEPHHRTNRFDDYPVESRSLRARMKEAFDTLAKAALSGGERTLDAETQERIRRLGYVGGK